MLLLVPAVLLLSALQAPADVRGCACDAANPESLKARECSLCAEAERQTGDAEFFVLRDANPRKPNRWLVLPRAHGAGPHSMADLKRDVRIRLWQRAVELAREKFGDAWGIAYNGPEVRTQCHLHIHVGRFITAAEDSRFKTVRRIEDFPAPATDGVWIHPVAGGFHVHGGGQTMETVLVR